MLLSSIWYPILATYRHIYNVHVVSTAGTTYLIQVQGWLLLGIPVDMQYS